MLPVCSNTPQEQTKMQDAPAEGCHVCSQCRDLGRGALLNVDGRQCALLDVEQAVGRGGRLDMAVVSQRV